MEMMTFFVPGVAKPKGTLVSGTKKDGGRFQRNQDKGHSDWKARVCFAVREAVGDTPLLQGPVFVKLTFYYERPKKHFFTGKRADVLRPDAPDAPCSGGKDVDKLQRMIFDALTGIVYKDDSQVSAVVARKRWGVQPGVRISLRNDVVKQKGGEG
jgi:Holliday junction resolvase RusA-like endonuclease